MQNLDKRRDGDWKLPMTRTPRSKTVHRIFDRFSSEERANRAASHRMGHLQRKAVGSFFYVSELVDGIAFPTRGRAEEAERNIAQ